VGVRDALTTAEVVLTSELTRVECERALIRGVATGRLPEAVAADRRAHLARAAEFWTTLTLDAEILSRARRPFPREPIRTLDAIHLATALAARESVPGFDLLSLDERLRLCGRELGFDLLP
jgi:predicted nucleic acid-binding protein